MQTKETGKQKSHSYPGKEGSRMTMAAYREGKDNERTREPQGKNQMQGNKLDKRKRTKRKGREEPALDIKINQYENRYNAPSR